MTTNELIKETEKGYIITFNKVSYMINETTIKIEGDYIITNDKYYLYEEAVELLNNLINKL